MIKSDFMKKISLLFAFFMTVLTSYSQVTTDSKKQAGNISINDNTKIKQASLTPLCYGKIAADGKIISGTGNFSVVRPPNQDGWYQVVVSGITEKSIVFVNASGTTHNCAYQILKDDKGLKLLVCARKLGEVFTTDAEFQFIIYNP